MTESPKSSKTPKRNGSWWRKNWFYTVLITVALLGGLGAFWIPFRLPQPFSKGDSISTLRQSILAATGGILAILTLWENRRKNIQEKEKNDQDHTRQVHAERRARYAKAIEQLADEKAPIRLGGVYTLIKLVDEWLADEKTLPSMEKRCQEGQIIIDSLCAYIRSSFPLAERHDELTLSYEEYQQKYQDNQGKNQATQSVENSVDNPTPKAEHQDKKRSNQSREEFVRDKSLFREEQEVRQTILSEIKKRLHIVIQHKESPPSTMEGTWSHFDYDFSEAIFFYKFDISGSHFKNELIFTQAIFCDSSHFEVTKFIQGPIFTNAEFKGKSTFLRAEFSWSPMFDNAVFHKEAIFSSARFTWGYFWGTKFYDSADFGSVYLHSPINFLDNTLYNKNSACFNVRSASCFTTSPDSPDTIEIEYQELNGIKRNIPKGTTLFDPNNFTYKKDMIIYKNLHT